MTEDELNKAIEVAEESVAGFADDGSFEQLLAMAVLELKDRVLKEREACAKLCDDRVTAYQYATDSWAQEHIKEARHLVKAIRARGQE